MSAVLELLAALLLVGGASVVALAALGVARLPDPFSRMHAAAKAAVGGAGLLLLGAGLAFGTAGALLTALAAIGFLVITTPLASHALGRVAYLSGAPLGTAAQADALAGVLRRGVFDIGQTRPRHAPGDMLQEVSAMTHSPDLVPVDRSADAGPRLAGEPAARRVLCCLLGGPSQQQASELAIELAEACAAEVTALSGAGLEVQDWRGPLPVGGAFWADWLSARSRARIREACAEALQHFQALAHARPGLRATARHEETGTEALPWLVAGHDLVVMPAGIGPTGQACEPGREIAAMLGSARVAPVLRVRENPGRVRSIVIVVGNDPACGSLAAGLLRVGLWRNATIFLLPVASDMRPRVAALAAAQAALLQAHGRRVRLLRPIGLDFEADELHRALGRFDLAVMPCLSGRHGGFFDAIRGCAFETTAATVPITLLP